MRPLMTLICLMLLLVYLSLEPIRRSPALLIPRNNPDRVLSSYTDRVFAVVQSRICALLSFSLASCSLLADDHSRGLHFLQIGILE